MTSNRYNILSVVSLHSLESELTNEVDIFHLTPCTSDNFITMKTQSNYSVFKQSSILSLHEKLF